MSQRGPTCSWSLTATGVAYYAQLIPGAAPGLVGISRVERALWLGAVERGKRESLPLE